MAERPPLKPVAAAIAALVPLGEQSGKPSLPLGRPFTLVGSRNRAHLRLVSSSVSRNHACIISTDSGLYLRDLASRHGVLVNNRHVNKEVDLSDGDIVQIGSFSFTFSDPSSVRMSLRPRAPGALLEMDGALTSIEARTLLIGRRPTCDIAIDEANVSNSHAIIFEVNGQRFIRDLGSRTGTLINGKAIYHQLLQFGDRLKVGRNELRYVSATAPREEPQDMDLAELLEAAPQESSSSFGFASQHVQAQTPAPAFALEQTEAPTEELAPLPMIEPEAPAMPLEPAASMSDDHDDDRVHLTSDDTHSGISAEDSLGASHTHLDVPSPVDQAMTAHETDLAAQPEDGLGEDFWADDSDQKLTNEAPAVPVGLEPIPIELEPEPQAVHEPEPAPPAPAPEPEATIAEPLPPPAPEPMALEPEPQEEIEAAPEPVPAAAAEEVEIPPAPQTEVLDEPPPPAPTLEEMDLSAVNFDAESAPAPTDEAPPAVEEPVAPATPAPLLDLAVPPPAVPATTATSAGVIAAGAAAAGALSEAAPPSDRRRGRKKGAAPAKPRAPRRRKSDIAEAPVAEVKAPEPVVAEPAGQVEILDRTDPSPDSALNFEQSLPVDESAVPDQPVIAEPALSDTSFGRTVEEFSGGEETGSLVETASHLEPIAEAPQEAHATAAPPDEAAVTADADLNLDDALDFDTAAPAEELQATAPHDLEPALDLELEAEPSPLDDLGPTTEPVAEAPAPVAPRPPADPFMGMQRDLGSFIGGMPIQLPPIAPPRAAPAAVAPAAAPPPPVAPSEPHAEEPFAADEELRFDEPETIPELEASVQEDDSLELFGDTPEALDALPDEIHPIEDVTEALAEQPAPVAPPPPAPAKPAAPPAQASKAAAPPAKSPSPFATGAPPRPKTVTPPRPARPIRNPFDVTPDDVSDNAAAIPPFGGRGRATAGQVTGAFDGLAMPPVREVDVFSQTAFPPMDPSMFGPAATRPAGLVGAAATGPAGAPAAQPAAEPEDVSEEPVGAAPPPRAAKTRGRPAAIPPNRQENARRPGTPAAPKEPSGQKAGGFLSWLRKPKLLLLFMLLSLGIAWAAVYFSFTPDSTVQSTLRFSGLDRINMLDRRDRLTQVKLSLRNPDVRRVALAGVSNERISPGFLNEGAAFDELASRSSFDEKRSALIFTRRSSEPDRDRVRMRALLSAVYAEDGKLRDASASARAKLESARQTMAAAEARQAAAEGELHKITGDLQNIPGPVAHDVLADPALLATQLEQNDKPLRDAWDASTHLLNQRRMDLERASAEKSVDVDADPQVKQMQTAVAELTSRLEAARSAQGGKNSDATRTFDAALADFEKQLAAIEGVKDDPKLAQYVESARQARDDIRQFTEQMAQRHQSDDEALAQLKRRAVEANENRLREIWDKDEQLKGLALQRDMQSHRFEAAIGSGYADEAAKIKPELDALDQKIEARRAALTGPEQPADPSRVMAQETIDRMQKDRQRDEQQLQEKLEALASLAPPMDRIAPGQRDAAIALAKNVSAMASAHDRSISASTADLDARVKKIEHDLAQQTARLEARRKELADANARGLDDTGRKGRTAAIAATQKALDLAKSDEAKAALAYNTNRQLLSMARELKQANGKSAALALEAKTARDEFQRAGTVADAFALLEPPDDNSVTTLFGRDTRIGYAGGATALIVLLFGALMLSAVRHNSAGEHVPLADVHYDEYGTPEDQSDGYGPTHSFDDEEEAVPA